MVRSKTASCKCHAVLPPSASSKPAIISMPASRGRTLGGQSEIEASRQLAESGAWRIDGAARRCRPRELGESPGRAQQLIVRGQANLLPGPDRARGARADPFAFADLETKKDVIELLNRAEGGEGVRIFIGSENKLFSLSGSSMIAAPFHDREQRIVGVLGRDRSDAAELLADRADGRLYLQARRTRRAKRIGKINSQTCKFGC